MSNTLLYLNSYCQSLIQQGSLPPAAPVAASCNCTEHIAAIKVHARFINSAWINSSWKMYFAKVLFEKWRLAREMSRDNFASPRVPALSEEKNTSRPACSLLDRVVFAQTADVNFYFYASLYRIFSPNPRFHFSCDGCSHCEPPQAERQVVYHSCD